MKEGGLLDVVTRELEVECLPADIPSSIQADLSSLAIGSVLRVADLAPNDKVRILGDAERVVAHVVAQRAETAEAGAVAAPTAEPEVVTKGTKDEEGAKAAPKAAEKKEKNYA